MNVRGHPGLDTTSDVIARPPFPDGPTQALGRSEDVVTGLGGGTILFPATAILADGDDCGATSIKDRGVTTAGVEGVIAQELDPRACPLPGNRCLQR